MTVWGWGGKIPFGTLTKKANKKSEGGGVDCRGGVGDAFVRGGGVRGGKQEKLWTYDARGGGKKKNGGGGGGGKKYLG